MGCILRDAFTHITAAKVVSETETAKLLVYARNERGGTLPIDNDKLD